MIKTTTTPYTNETQPMARETTHGSRVILNIYKGTTYHQPRVKVKLDGAHRRHLQSTRLHGGITVTYTYIKTQS